MSGFDTVIIVDWSARSAPSPARPTKDSIWIAVARDGTTETTYHRTRDQAMTWLGGVLDGELAAGRRVLAGFDFPFGYPAGFARRVTGRDDPLALWEDIDARIEDAPDNANNRFAVAADLNRLFPGTGPFWGRPAALDLPDLPDKGRARDGHGMAERRKVEDRLPKAQSCWKLFTTGSVGSQTLMGLPRLQGLRRRFGARLSVWPFEEIETPIVLAEIYPSMLALQVAQRARANEIPDRAQVRVMAAAFHALTPEEMGAMLAEGDPDEGWILGQGHEAALIAALERDTPAPPPLKNDCFALPPGVDWTPVDEALGRLKDALHPVVAVETCPLDQAAGRVLAHDQTAPRRSPPHANSAVDGYGFAHPGGGEGVISLPLHPGRAAAGQAFAGLVPAGRALRILTGAKVPEGVDTVVLEEDCTVTDQAISFRGSPKRGANIRRAGEDVEAGEVILRAGQTLRAPDLALAASTGIGELPVYRRLKVAVFSTGDELADPGADAPAATFDANRPMLIPLLRGWGHDVVDLGRLPDTPEAVRAAFDQGAEQADAILTSGGASAGDEDHVSALLRAEGRMSDWRIALKPGRPLALAMWQGTPVFGLPGNPVAAFVCAVIFARPALSCMAGAGWVEPMRLRVPAAFTKSKKSGRNEYLRARLTADGRAEVFASEGSGRVSGLSWATGLVALGPEAAEITPGTLVDFLPYEGMGV